MEIKIDKTAFFLILILGVIAVPGAMLLAVWKLTHGLYWAEVHLGEMAAALISLVAAIGILRTSLRELAGATGISISETSIRKSGVTRRIELPWDQIDAIENSGVGVLTLRSGSQFIRLSTYLFGKREKLIKLIQKKTGRSISES